MRMVRTMLVTAFLGAAGVMGCSNTDLTGGFGTAKDNKDDADDDDDDDIKDGDEDPTNSDAGDGDADDGDVDGDDSSTDGDDLGDADGEGTPDEDGDIISSETGDTAKCWFMVSGGHFGWSSTAGESYGSTFPKPTGGGAITHGAKFDTVGGVFLNSRPDPFEYQKGGGEIDLAIDNTFDSIAIAPGMKVEIRDASGNVMHKGKGPYLALSNNYDHISNYPALSNLYRARENEMAPWMKAKFNELNYVLPRLNLHAARWVKVSKLKGVPCE